MKIGDRIEMIDVSELSNVKVGDKGTIFVISRRGNYAGVNFDDGSMRPSLKISRLKVIKPFNIKDKVRLISDPWNGEYSESVDVGDIGHVTESCDSSIAIVHFLADDGNWEVPFVNLVLVED
jgi:hypothetical protein